MQLDPVRIYTGSPDYYGHVFAPHQAERALRYGAGTVQLGHGRPKTALLPRLDQ